MRGEGWDGGRSATSGQRRRRQQGRMGGALGGVSCDVWSLVRVDSFND